MIARMLKLRRMVANGQLCSECRHHVREWGCYDACELTAHELAYDDCGTKYSFRSVRECKHVYATRSCEWEPIRNGGASCLV